MDIQFIVQAVGDRMTWWEIRKESILQKKEIREIKKPVLKKKWKARGNWKYAEIEEQDQMKWRRGWRRWDKNQDMDHTKEKAPRSSYHRAGRNGLDPRSPGSQHSASTNCAAQTVSALCFYSQTHTVECSSNYNSAVRFYRLIQWEDKVFRKL